jgi:RNA polymerase sigma-70 factor, ECF subfamily
MTEPAPNVTELLRAWTGGDVAARDRLMSVVYEDLRRRAAACLRREPLGDMQPTALVHEAYIRLVDQRRAQWQNRAQFFAVAAQMMRRILVDRARARKMIKRSGRWARITLDEAAPAASAMDVDVLDVDAALGRLAAFDQRKCQLAELRSSAGELRHRAD